MKKLMIAALLLLAGPALADTNVNGYFRKNGTYVQPYTRSSPNSDRSDNYGRAPKQDNNVYSSPYNRDSDHDGVSNQFDQDDNNNGVNDNLERR